VAGGAKKRRRRPRRGVLVRRWLGVGALCLVGLLYYRPLHAYLDTKRSLAARHAEVRGLEAQKRLLERQLTVSASTAALELQARRLALVRPGERLFIVKGIPAWRRHKATIGRDG